MNTFLLKLSSPDGDIFAGQVIGLFVRGTEGNLAVLAGHAPLITSVCAGEAHIDMEDGTTRYATLSGGLLTVAPEATTLLSSGFAWKEE